MSYALGLANHDFVLFCADQRWTALTGRQEDDFKKVFKLNDKVILACTGDVRSVFKLFTPFLIGNGYKKNRLEINPIYQRSDIAYDCACEVVNENYRRLIEENKTLSDPWTFVCSMGGWNGKCICMDVFYSNHEETGQPLRTAFTMLNPHDVKLASMGDGLHYQKYCELIKTDRLYNIEYYVDVFRRTLISGVQCDNSINTSYSYECVKRSDFK